MMMPVPTPDAPDGTCEAVLKESRTRKHCRKPARLYTIERGDRQLEVLRCGDHYPNTRGWRVVGDEDELQSQSEWHPVLGPGAG